MEFQVPQFISREATIVTGMSFRQFLTLVVAGFFILMLFFLLKGNLFLFAIAAILIAGIALIFSFAQMGGQPFPVVFKNFVFYFFKPRVYVWRHKGMPERLIHEGVEKIQIAESPEEKRKIGLTRESRVQKLRTQIETKS